MRLLYTFLIIIMFFFTVSITAYATDSVPIEVALQKKYESLKTFRAIFTQRLLHQESDSEEIRKGTLLFQKPLNIRWETEKPYPELLVVSADTVWDYLPDEELAYCYSPDVVKDSRSVIQVITGQTRLDKDFTVQSEKDDNGLAVLRLYPKDPTPQLVEAILWINKESKLITKVQIMDFYGNTNEIHFTTITPNIPLQSSIFSFTPPEGTTVENLKNQATPERPLLQ